MSAECGVHEEMPGRCRTCRGDGYVCVCGLDIGCECPTCETCGGTGDCKDCRAYLDEQERYWRWYFGAQIENEAQQRRMEREDHGRVLTDDERMEEARRLK